MVDLRRLSEVLSQYYGGKALGSDRQQLEVELIRARDDPSSVPLAWKALHEPEAAGELLLWFSALVLDRLVLARWDALAAGAQLETLTGMRDLLAERSAGWPRAVQLKVAQVYVRAGRQLWPEVAASFFDDILAFLRSDAHRSLGLRLVENMVAECGEPSRRTMLSARRRALARPLAERAPAVFAHISGALAAATDDSAREDSLNTLTACAQFLPVSASTVPLALVSAVCELLAARSHAVRFGALGCLRTLFERDVRGADAACLFLPTLVPLEAAVRRVAAAAHADADEADADAERGALCETVHALCARVLPRIGAASTTSCGAELGALLAALLALTSAARTRRAVRDAYGVWAALLDGLSAAVSEAGERATFCGLPRAQFSAEFGPGFGALLGEVLRRRRAAAASAVEALVPVGVPSGEGWSADGTGAAFADDDEEFALAMGLASPDEAFGLAAGGGRSDGEEGGGGGEEEEEDDFEAGGAQLDTDDDESDDDEEGAARSGVRGVPSRAESDIVSSLVSLWPSSAIALLTEHTGALCTEVAAAPTSAELLGALGALAPHASRAAAALGAGTAEGSAAAGLFCRAAVAALRPLTPPPPAGAPHARAATAARVGLLQVLGALSAPLAASLAPGPAQLPDSAHLVTQVIACSHAALREAAGGQVAGASLLARATTSLVCSIAYAYPAEFWLPAPAAAHGCGDVGGGGVPANSGGGAHAADPACRAAMAALLRESLELLPAFPQRARARHAFALATALLRPPRAGSSAAAYNAQPAAQWRGEALAQLVGACVRPWTACGLAPAAALDASVVSAAASAHDGRAGWALARATAASARALAAVARAAEGAARPASDAALAALVGWLPTVQALLEHYGAFDASGCAQIAAAAEAAEVAVLGALSGLSSLALALARSMRPQLLANGSLDRLLDALVALAAADRRPGAHAHAHAAEQAADGGAARAASSLEGLLLQLLARVGGSSRHWPATLKLCSVRLCGAPRERSAGTPRYHSVLDALVRERWRTLQADDAAVSALIQAYAAALLDPGDRAGFSSGLARLPRADAATGGLLLAHRTFAEARPAIAAALIRVAVEPAHVALRDEAIAGLHTLLVGVPDGLAPLALVDEALAACAHLDAAQREGLRAAYGRDHADARDLPSFRLMMASLADDVLVIATVQADSAALHAA